MTSALHYLWSVCNWFRISQPEEEATAFSSISVVFTCLISTSITNKNFQDLMANLNLIEAVRTYINRMIDACGPCMKSLVMDKETVQDTNSKTRLIDVSLVIFLDCDR